MMCRVLVLGAALLLSSACSSIQIAHHSRGIQPPFCVNGLQGSTVAVYWDSAWRHNQKEVAVREAIFAEGLSEFLPRALCLRTVKISRTIEGTPVSMSTEPAIASDAKSSGAAKAIVFRIEELGPNLMLYLSPVLWQTKNEVRLRVKIIDAKTGAVDTDTATHWYRGGPFTFHGAGSLSTDLQGTLEALFLGKER